MSFEELGLSPEILSAVKAKNYQTPTPIQEKAIPLVLEGRDVMGCAQTGTGKTAAFALPILQRLARASATGRSPRGTTPRAAGIPDAAGAAAPVHPWTSAVGRSARSC